MSAKADLKIAVVIPCYRVRAQILDVLSQIDRRVNRIYVVDDFCPEKSGEFVKSNLRDSRIRVIFHSANQGVGGAVISGYKAAMEEGMDVIVKIDGASPVVQGYADYSKGNRFDSLDNLVSMPKIRIFGNAILSIWSKISSGYWTITDPTNGFTAIHRKALEAINLDKVRKSFFFESDLLFRLNIANCVVVDVPMVAVYGNETSNLRIRKVLFEFPWRHSVNFLKRIFYRYYLREWSVGSFELPFGVLLLLFGIWFGLTSYFAASAAGVPTTAGQVTASAVALILGVQLLLSFLAYDVQAEPRIPRQAR
jgi:glycosyltransferase involved in cell wall biosynthesis